MHGTQMAMEEMTISQVHTNAQSECWLWEDQSLSVGLLEGPLLHAPASLWGWGGLQLVFWLFALSLRSEGCCGVASLDEFPDTSQPYPQKRSPSGDFHHHPCGTWISFYLWLYPGQRFSRCPVGHLVLAGGTLDCHSWGGVTGTYWVEARDAAKYPTVHKTALTTKSSSPKCQCWWDWETLILMI